MPFKKGNVPWNKGFYRIWTKEWDEEKKEKARQRSKEYRSKNKEIIKKRRMDLKLEVFQYYSGKEVPECACCGKKDFDSLSIDHLDGGGKKHRKSIGNRSGKEFYRWLKKNNYPEEYQVLCINCNRARGENKQRFCPDHHPELYPELKEKYVEPIKSPCIICGKEIPLDRWLKSGYTLRTCSEECHKEVNRRRMKIGRNRRRNKFYPPPNVCEVCGKPLPLEKWVKSGYRLKTCSRKCYRIFQNKRGRLRYRFRKEKVLRHYSGGKPKCACCGTEDFWCLTIDHLERVHYNQNKDPKRRMGYGSYAALIRDNFPEGYQVLCMECNMRKRFTDKRFCKKHHPEL